MILTTRPVTVTAAFALAAFVMAASACGGGSGTTDDATKPQIVATTSIWADITAEVLCGTDVPALIPPGADPHSFEPSLRDRELIDGALMVVANGGGLEASLVDLLATAAADGTNLVELTPFVDVIAHDEPDDDQDDDQDDESDDESDDGHGHDVEVDPHIWQDPNRVIGAVEVIASAVRALGLRDCAADYTTELLALDREIDELLAPISAERRQMVTSHDSLAYFADRYDMEIVGTVIPSTNTLAQTNAADLAALADLIDARGVTAIFTEQLESTADADALASRLGVTVVPLVTDALTDDPGSDTYLEMMLSNATSIAQALSP
jgi:ABC-type Zn uptake system ZnuABC Zn-binding protein ZnuA